MMKFCTGCVKKGVLILKHDKHQQSWGYHIYIYIMEILMGICSSKIGATHCIENDLVIRQNRSEYSLDKIQDPLQPSMHFNFQQVSDLGDDQDRFPCSGRVCDKNAI
jgi:hypothetical protein